MREIVIDLFDGYYGNEHRVYEGDKWLATFHDKEDAEKFAEWKRLEA